MIVTSATLLFFNLYVKWLIRQQLYHDLLGRKQNPDVFLNQRRKFVGLMGKIKRFFRNV